jgi:hypothetical protein
MKSSSIIGTNGPKPPANVLKAAFSSGKERERRHERDSPESKVDAQEVFDTRPS